MFDSDLAGLYGVPTKAVNQAVRRNGDRFPVDFAFRLSIDDLENWRSQIQAVSELPSIVVLWSVTSEISDALHSRRPPARPASTGMYG